jgi:hypothetical protein
VKPWLLRGKTKNLCLVAFGLRLARRLDGMQAFGKVAYDMRRRPHHCWQERLWISHSQRGPSAPATCRSIWFSRSTSERDELVALPTVVVNLSDIERKDPFKRVVGLVLSSDLKSAGPRTTVAKREYSFLKKRKVFDSSGS